LAGIPMINLEIISSLSGWSNIFFSACLLITLFYI
jgi:hypothetical protein